MTPLTSICGLKEMDKNIVKMLIEKCECDTKGRDCSKELCEYFGFEEADKHHMKVRSDLDLILKSIYVDIDSAILKEEKEDIMNDAWQIDVSQLPETVKFIRFENAY